MLRSRILPGLLLLSLACAGSNNPKTDDGPAQSEAGDDGKPVEADGAEPNDGEPVGEGGGQECSSDADCVPAQCCHPTSCVPASATPDCAGVACTTECRTGSLDCGQGHCVCQNGTCGAIIGESL